MLGWWKTTSLLIFLLEKGLLARCVWFQFTLSIWTNLCTVQSGLYLSTFTVYTNFAELDRVAKIGVNGLMLTCWTQLCPGQSGCLQLVRPHNLCVCIYYMCGGLWQVKSRSKECANITRWTPKALRQVAVGCWIVWSLGEKCPVQALVFQAGLIMQQLVGGSAGGIVVEF